LEEYERSFELLLSSSLEKAVAGFATVYEKFQQSYYEEQQMLIRAFRRQLKKQNLREDPSLKEQAAGFWHFSKPQNLEYFMSTFQAAPE